MSLSTLSRGRTTRLVQRAVTSACNARVPPVIARNGAAPLSRIHEQFAPRVAQPVRYIHTSPTVHAVQQFKLADIGEGIAEVQLTEWYVKVGDKVKEMDNLAAVESDKASVELTSPYTGTVKKLHFKLNDQVKVGSVLIDIETAGGPPPKAPTKAPAAKPAASGSATQVFKLADIGEGIAEVQLTEWFVKVGDKVKEMDNLASVESDKASVELTSPYTGTVTKLNAKVNDTIKVGAAVCEIETTGGGAPAKQESAPAAAAGGGGGVQTFNLSDIGEGIAEVQVTEVFVKEGDMVKEFDNLFAVESDKASVELPSPFTGKVKKIHHKVNDTVKVGSPLIDIETAGGAPAAKPAASAPGGDILATPKIRALAKAEGVDLSNVQGTGPKGRITKEDVLAAKGGSGAPAPAAAKVPTPSAKPAAAAGKAAPAGPARPTVRPGEEKVVQITDNVGKGMVKSMVASLDVPYMALGEEIDVTQLVMLQKSLKAGSLKKYGTRPTITTFLLKAISLALDEHPVINSKFGPITANPPQYTMYGNHNISVAIDSPNGLVVPNIKDVGNMSLIDIQNDLLRLAEAAQKGKLAMGDITGGTITFSNVGTIGTKDPRPILFDGQAVIGAAGRTMTLPRYNDKGELVARQIMNVRWVGDHRHLDGASLARFSNSFKRYCENPGEWLLALR